MGTFPRRPGTASSPPFVYAGSDLDGDDSQARPAQADEIMTCVPRRLQRAEARVLPAPQIHCAR